MHLVQSMAYTGQTPWHGLGQRLSPNQPLEVWAEQAGMNWRIETADVQFASSPLYPAPIHSFPEQRVLYRSDTKSPLSVVSSRYKVVQPAEILEFYRDLTDVGGYELETAGVLKDGKKLWALARTGQSVTLKGRDTVDGYLLLATACDGTLATVAQFTSIRVVCNNTLAIALGNNDGAVRVPHRTEFDADVVKQRLGIAVAPWSSFSDYIKELANYRVPDRVANNLLQTVFANPMSTSEPRTSEVNDRAVQKVLSLYAGKGLGAERLSAAGTAWGLLNGVTEFVDHHRRARSSDHRRDGAWFGQGAQIKQRAWNEALKLIA